MRFSYHHKLSVRCFAATQHRSGATAVWFEGKSARCTRKWTRNADTRPQRWQSTQQLKLNPSQPWNSDLISVQLCGKPSCKKRNPKNLPRKQWIIIPFQRKYWSGVKGNLRSEGEEKNSLYSSKVSQRSDENLWLCKTLKFYFKKLLALKSEFVCHVLRFLCFILKSSSRPSSSSPNHVHHLWFVVCPALIPLTCHVQVSLISWASLCFLSVTMLLFSVSPWDFRFDRIFKFLAKSCVWLAPLFLTWWALIETHISCHKNWTLFIMYLLCLDVN